MRRGTTPTNTFKTNVDLSAAKVFITYAQNNLIILEKTNSDITFSTGQSGEYLLAVELSQQDTLAFGTGNVIIQIRAVFNDGTAIASNIVRTTAEMILKDGVISYAV